MSFQGADVDGLDRTANRCMEGADFADTVAKALEILVAALEAMSWTGFAAALAAYLKAVVIPWVKYIAKCLRIFGGILQLASSKQKDASEDTPQISIPATAWNPPPAPAAVQIDPPRLSSPQPAIQQTGAGTGAETGGGSSVAPVTTIGGTTAGGTGTGGGSASTPTTTIGRTSPGSTVGNVTGGGTVTTVTGITPDGEVWTSTRISGGGTAATPTYLPSSSSSSDLSSIGRGTTTGATIPTTAIDDCFGTGSVGSGSGGSGSSGGTGSGGTGSGNSGSGSGSFGTGSLGSSGSGSTGGGTSGGTGGGTGGGSGTGSSGTGSSDGSPLASGNATIQSTPLQARSAATLSTGGTGTSSVAATSDVGSGGLASAALAAPVGLAGVGTAALAALRAKGKQADDEEEVDSPL